MNVFRAVLMFCFCALLVGCSSVPVVELRHVDSIVSLNGEWQFIAASRAPESPFAKDANTASWDRIIVPGNWFRQNKQVDGVAWYRRAFTVDAGPQALVMLHFEGVDYAADIWVNGNYVGRHQGYFDQFSFDVSALVNASSENSLTVRVDSPREHPDDWSLDKWLIKGVLSHHDTRPGGAWSVRGQDGNTGGIWGDVRLQVTRDVAIDNIQWQDKVDALESSASTVARVGLVSRQGVDAEYWLRLTEYEADSDNPGASSITTVRLTGDYTEAKISLDRRPVSLWQPFEYGKPTRYRYELEVGRGDAVLTRKTVHRGIRKIRRDQETGQWYVNGQRIFLRGTNYIPGQWFSELDYDVLRHDLDLMRRANINAVRVHAMVLPRRFYNLADEMGILVWQDYPLQWGYSDNPVFHNEAHRQLGRMLRQLNSHASIIAWSMHNEPPWDAQWMKYKYPGYNPDQNRELDSSLAHDARLIDGTRHIHEVSKTSEHPWFGWYSGTWRDYSRPAKETLITEFGAQALPRLETLRRIFDAKFMWPDSDQAWSHWRYHNFQPRESFEIAGIERGESIAEFIANSQAYQQRLIKFAAESYRRQRYNNVAAIFQFMFVEGWPSINWGVVDYRRNPKPGYGALQISYQPVLPSFEIDQFSYDQRVQIEVPIWIVNDLHQGFSGTRLEISIWKDQNLEHAEELDLSIAADSAREVSKLAVDLDDSGIWRLDLKLRASNGRVLGTNSETIKVALKSKSNTDSQQQ